MNMNLVEVPKFVLESVEVIGVQCADTGKCHHQCKEKCFRKDGCVPLSCATWLDDKWNVKKP